MHRAPLRGATSPAAVHALPCAGWLGCGACCLADQPGCIPAEHCVPAMRPSPTTSRFRGVPCMLCGWPVSGLPACHVVGLHGQPGNGSPVHAAGSERQSAGSCSVPLQPGPGPHLLRVHTATRGSPQYLTGPGICARTPHTWHPAPHHCNVAGCMGAHGGGLGGHGLQGVTRHRALPGQRLDQACPQTYSTVCPTHQNAGAGHRPLAGGLQGGTDPPASGGSAPKEDEVFFGLLCKLDTHQLCWFDVQCAQSHSYLLVTIPRSKTDPLG